MSNFWGAHQNRAMAHIRVTDDYASVGSLCASLARQPPPFDFDFDFDFDKV